MGSRTEVENMVIPNQPEPLGRPRPGDAEAAVVTEPSWAGGDEHASAAEAERTLELREEQLVAHKELRTLGEVEVRTEIDEVPGRLEVDAFREEVEVEHEPVGQVVSERDQPWDEGGVLVVPIYEEQLVVTKRLVLRERLRVRRVGTTERRLFQDTLRSERLVVEDPQHTGLVHERYPTGEVVGEHPADADGGAASDDAPAAEHGEKEEGGFLENLVRKALE
jgi:uncharacterized protein (TIGR02271 family)